MGISNVELPTIPENDYWLYNTTRNDVPTEHRIMICHCFVCNVWRSAGVLGNADFNCNEMALWDTSKLNIFDNNFARPQ